MVSITADLIRYSFPSSTFSKGRDYQRTGAVVLEYLSPDHSVVEGLVQGTRRKPYSVAVELKVQRNGNVRISGHCSCPMTFNCKHVVALLLQAEQMASAPDPAPDPVPVASAPYPPEPVLSASVEGWLAHMERVGQFSTREDYPPTVRRRLVYVLSLPLDRNGSAWAKIHTMSVQLLKDGSFSPKVRVFQPSSAFGGAPAQFLRSSDISILKHMTFTSGEMRLEGEGGVELLEKILATGRCHWETVAGPVLQRGDARAASVRWTGIADGRQRPQIEVTGGGCAVPLTPPWYVDSANQLCGPVELSMPPRLAKVLLEAPPVDVAELDEVRRRLSAILPEAEAYLPPELAPATKLVVSPVPRLLLHHQTVQEAGYFYGRDTFVDMPLARLSFLYGDHEISSASTRATLTLVDGNTVTEIVRSAQEEKAAVRRLHRLGFMVASEQQSWRVPAECGHDFMLEPGADEEAWVDFLVHDVPELTAAGWHVSIADDFPVRVVHPEGTIEAEVQEKEGIDWFDLHLGVLVNGERIDILPMLLTVLRKIPGDDLLEFLEDSEIDNRMLHLRLEDGRILPLPFSRVRPILRALAALFSSEEGGVRLTRADAPDVAAFAEALPNLVWRGGEKLRELGRRLRDHSGIPAVVLPDLFHGTLRPYQQAGVEWMQLLRDVGLGGILADDMGLGKTVQTLAHVAVEKAAGRLDRPCLVIAPTSLMANWQAEAETFTPSLRTLVLQGPERKTLFPLIDGSDIVFSTYPLLARDADELTARPWHMVILDEAQYVKNPVTSTAKALRMLEARHRLALSGTPLENHLGELWALFDFVSPGFLGDRAAFTRQWRTPIEKKGDAERRAALARRVKPFLLRRTKAQVVADLPPKTEIIEHVDLTDSQRALYEGVRLTMHKKVREAIAAKGLKRSRIELLDALLKLRQACCDPRLVKAAGGKARAESAKLIRLMEMIPEMIREGRRILLFSQFTSMLALVEAELQAADVPYVLLTGDTKDRATPVRRFQNGEVPLFLISLKAGGTGLNLTAADTVIHYDPWWNPAVEAQATDRAHRIGQDKPVFVYKLVAGDSIEVKMSELKARKQALADGLFDPEAGSAIDIGEDDVEFLLGS